MFFTDKTAAQENSHNLTPCQNHQFKFWIHIMFLLYFKAMKLLLGFEISYKRPHADKINHNFVNFQSSIPNWNILYIKYLGIQCSHIKSLYIQGCRCHSAPWCKVRSCINFENHSLVSSLCLKQMEFPFHWPYWRSWGQLQAVICLPEIFWRKI